MDHIGRAGSGVCRRNSAYIYRPGALFRPKALADGPLYKRRSFGERNRQLMIKSCQAVQALCCCDACAGHAGVFNTPLSSVFSYSPQSLKKRGKMPPQLALAREAQYLRAEEERMRAQALETRPRQEQGISTSLLRTGAARLTSARRYAPAGRQILAARPCGLPAAPDVKSRRSRGCRYRRMEKFQIERRRRLAHAEYSCPPISLLKRTAGKRRASRRKSGQMRELIAAHELT